MNDTQVTNPAIAVGPLGFGSMVVAITNALGVMWNPLLVALVASFAFGGVVFTANTDTALTPKRFFVWIITSLTIFCTAAGTNEVGATFERQISTRPAASAMGYPGTTAYAQSRPVPTPLAPPIFKPWFPERVAA